MGDVYGQPYHPGSGFLPRQEGGGWGDPAAPGSAFDKTLAGVGGGGEAAPTGETGEEGLTPVQKYRKRQVEQEAAKTRATTKTKNDLLMTEAIDGLRRELDP